MKSRRRICIALGASLTLGLTGVAVAATVTPPAGTPNLAAMVLQPGDLAAGAVAVARCHWESSLRVSGPA